MNIGRTECCKPNTNFKARPSYSEPVSKCVKIKLTQKSAKSSIPLHYTTECYRIYLRTFIHENVQRMQRLYISGTECRDPERDSHKLQSHPFPDCKPVQFVKKTCWMSHQGSSAQRNIGKNWCFNISFHKSGVWTTVKSLPFYACLSVRV